MLGGWGPTFVGGYPGAQTLYPTKLVSNLLLLIHRGIQAYRTWFIDRYEAPILDLDNICIYMYTHTYTHIYIYIYTYIHTHIHV